MIRFTSAGDPKVLDVFAELTGHVLDGKRIEPIHFESYLSMDEDFIWVYDFTYGMWDVLLSVRDNFCGVPDRLGITQLTFTHTVTRDGVDIYINPKHGTVGAGEQLPIGKKMASIARYDPGDDNPFANNPPQSTGRRASRVQHGIKYDPSTRTILCKCFDNPKQIWCEGIKNLLQSGTDILVVNQVVDALNSLVPRTSADDYILVSVPVMPRAALNVTVHRYMIDGLELPETQIRFEVNQDIQMWWEPGMSFRPLVAEVFAYLTANPIYAKWRELVEWYCNTASTRTQHRENPKKLPCPNKWHSNNDLFYEMINERINTNDSESTAQNLTYVATLYAFYDLYYDRCYSCHVSFRPENDVPVF